MPRIEKYTEAPVIKHVLLVAAGTSDLELTEALRAAVVEVLGIRNELKGDVAEVVIQAIFRT